MMFTRSQARKHSEKYIRYDEEINEQSDESDSDYFPSDSDSDSDSDYLPSDSSEYSTDSDEYYNESGKDIDLEKYVELACDKLVRVMVWLKHEAHLDDKIDTLEKIDELFEEKERLSFTRITDETLKMLRKK